MADISNPSTWPSLATGDAEWDGVVKSLPDGPPDIGAFTDIPSLRQFVAAAKGQSSLPPAPAGIKEEERQISMRDGHKIAVRIHGPEKAPSGGSPLGVLYHGGGWCIGGLDDEVPLIRRLVSDYGMTVVNVDYRMGPEYKFPAASDDCFDATKWVCLPNPPIFVVSLLIFSKAAENASALGADPSKGFIIGGNSAGGNLTAVVSLLWRDANITPKLTGALLKVPAVCSPVGYPEKYRKELQSWDQLEFAAILSRKAFDLFMNNYIPDVEQRKDPRMSPLLWKTGLQDLPPQVFQICGADPLRDEALVYERILREDHGVKTKVEMYPGLPHGFWSLFPQMKASEKFMDDSVKAVGWLLEQK
ncbi:hypothetical protein PRZ48_004725 [Zasmidium cellare]|uniref:Alpha/beta hydrolase fold-3 domain-containing protein n=1 Tax=Zasmidium cellare TaxID=395010 RepID=A0ABR0EQP1_ZASCE|nr:hypothetical protein PRZ48_004725 [Zasmidium cellare]